MLWKAYFVLFAVFESYLVEAFFAHQGPRTLIGWVTIVLLTPLALSGLIARAYNRKIVSAEAWKAAFAIYCLGSALNIFESFYVPASRPTGVTARLCIEMVVLLIFTIPPGVALYQSGFSRADLRRT